MFIKPGINPDTGQPQRILYPHTFLVMPEDGAEVGDHDFYFLTLKLHGDVVDAEPATESNENPTEAGQDSRLHTIGGGT